jgi:hypothetical protein
MGKPEKRYLSQLFWQEDASDSQPQHSKSGDQRGILSIISEFHAKEMLSCCYIILFEPYMPLYVDIIHFCVVFLTI